LPFLAAPFPSQHHHSRDLAGELDVDCSVAWAHVRARTGSGALQRRGAAQEWCDASAAPSSLR
jgi:hypothetical protein